MVQIKLFTFFTSSSSFFFNPSSSLSQFAAHSPSPPPSLPSVALPEADATNKTQLCHPCQRYPRQWLGWGASRLRAQEENGWEVILHNHVAGEVRAVGLSNGRATIHQHTTTPRPNWIQHKLHGAIHGSFVPPLQKKKSPNAKNTPPS